MLQTSHQGFITHMSVDHEMVMIYVERDLEGQKDLVREEIDPLMNIMLSKENPDSAQIQQVEADQS